MRHISFALTTKQVRNRTKTVTRRLGWKTLQPGTLLQPVVQAQGLAKGERVERIGGPIRVLSVRRERLDAITYSDVVREGFPLPDGVAHTPHDEQVQIRRFLAMFCEHNDSEPGDKVTRIEFEYTEEP